MTLDATEPIMNPSGCQPKKVNYNVYLMNSEGKQIVTKPIATNVGYGSLHFDSLPKGTYKFITINWGDTSLAKDFLVEISGKDKAMKLGKPAASFGAHPKTEWKDKGSSYVQLKYGAGTLQAIVINKSGGPLKA